MLLYYLEQLKSLNLLQIWKRMQTKCIDVPILSYLAYSIVTY